MESESTQFFQFDQAGNMYVFAPGAGCTGPTRLVRPVDELIFNSSYNPSNWAMDNSIKNGPEENKLLYTCLGGCDVPTGRDFKPPLTEEQLSHKNFSEETIKQICWVRKMYHEWRAFRHTCGLSYIHCGLEDKATITAESLKYALCQFIMRVKKLNGDHFPAKMLYHLIVCVQFHLECLDFAFKLINDPAFKDLKFTLDNTMKAHVSQEIGISMKRAEVLTATDKDLLWSLGFLGMSHLEQLLNTVIFCVGKGFAL